MSVHITSPVWKLQLEPTLKLILLKLADCADEGGHNARPSVERIAVECCVSESTVRRSLAKLRAAGLLVVTRKATQHRPTVYQVVPSSGVKLIGPASPARDLNRQPRPVKSSPSDLTAMTPDPSFDPSFDPSSSARARAQGAPPPACATDDHDDAERNADAPLDEAAKAVQMLLNRHLGGSIHTEIAWLLQNGVAPVWFSEVAERSETQAARAPWPYLRGVLDHWRLHGHRCDCRRPAGAGTA